MRTFRRRFSSLRQCLVSPLVPTVLSLSVLAWGAACGSKKDDDTHKSEGTGSDTSSGGSGTGGSDGASGAGNDTGGTTGNTDPNNTACGLANAPQNPSSDNGSTFKGCTGVSLEAEPVPADILILLDRSSSMGEYRVGSDPDSPTRWEAITTALKDFLNTPESSVLRIGLQYFPQMGDMGATECNAEGYASPTIPIALMTEDHRDALVESIDQNFPSGLTPAIPALDGALQYARQWAEDNPERPTVLLWAADGYPTECEDTDITTLENLAEEYSKGTPRVATFVVGLGLVANLQRVADKGGTEAFFVSDCPTAVEDLKATLKRVSSSPTLCEFDLPEPPEGEFLDKNKVNVTFTPKGSSTEIVGRVLGPEHCVGGGWHYDDEDDPTSIQVCPASCSHFGGGRIDIVVGCESVSLQ